MHIPLKVTADTSADRKLLKKLRGQGLLEFTYINLENAKDNVGRGVPGWSDDNHPAIFTLNSSGFMDGDVLGPSDSPGIESKLRAILGGKRQNLMDRRQLLAHFYSDNDVFVTGDKGDISDNKEELSLVGITVLSNGELLEYIEKIKQDTKD